MKRTMAFLTTAVMMLASVPVLSVNAETAYAAGDVDMDGVITGHDTAMVSRYILDDTYSLTEEQLELADINEDGEVNQADADYLHEIQEYNLGDVIMNKGVTAFDDFDNFQKVHTHYVKSAAGLPVEEWTQVQENLADMNLDGIVDLTDSYWIMKQYVVLSVGGSAFPVIGMYYFDDSWLWCSSVSADGWVK